MLKDEKAAQDAAGKRKEPDTEPPNPNRNGEPKRQDDGQQAG